VESKKKKKSRPFLSDVIGKGEDKWARDVPVCTERCADSSQQDASRMNRKGKLPAETSQIPAGQPPDRLARAFSLVTNR